MASVGRAQLVEQLTRHLEQRPEILDAYLFGSLSRGPGQPHSDVDVAVYIDRERVADTPFGYAAELTTILSTAVGSDAVDVIVLNDAPPLLYHRVLRDGARLLARDLPATTTREGRALSRYCDFLPQMRKVDAAYQDRLRRGSPGHEPR
jgi:predicted nucleotidyltransferase